MGLLRVVIGLLGLAAFAYLGWNTTQTVMNATTASAVQLIQLYAEGAFYGVVGAGLVLAAYVLTRAAP